MNEADGAVVATLREWAARTPYATALRWLDGAPRPAWTWADYAGAVGAAARELRSRGVRSGDRLVVVGGNEPAWVALRGAAGVLGLTFVPLSPRLAPPERDWQIANAAPRLVLGDASLAPGRLTVCDWSDFGGGACAPLPDEPAAPSAMQLLYTSGSSGRPKGVLRPRAADAARIRQTVDVYGLRRTDVHLVAGPLYHSGPALFYACFAAIGAEQWVLRRFDPERVAELASTGEVSALFMVPTMWRMLLDALRRRPRRLRLRIAWTAGSAMDVATRTELLAALGEGVLWEFYGATETGTVTILPPDKQRSHADTVGFAPPGVAVRIIGDDGRDCAAGEPGRVYVRSAMTMAGYHSGPGSDPPAVDRRGEWLSVGDRGWLKPDGALVLVGREGGMVITGGINVYPEEVEAALRQLPGVVEAVVFGVPDAQWGQSLAAVVEPAAGASLSVTDLVQGLRGKIAGFKIPRRWRIGPIPRTPSQKVVRDGAALAAWMDAGREQT